MPFRWKVGDFLTAFWTAGRLPAGTGRMIENWASDARGRSEARRAAVSATSGLAKSTPTTSVAPMSRIEPSFSKFIDIRGARRLSISDARNRPVSVSDVARE